MNVGDLVPLDIQETLFGDTMKGKMTGVIRSTVPFLRPVMGNLYLDIYHFYVPYRLCYDKAERVYGNPNPSAYVDNDLASFPMNVAESFVHPYSVGDYLGLAVGSGEEYFDGDVNIMPFRAFALIYDRWFRNENVTDEMFVQRGETVPSEAFNHNAWSPNNYTGMLPKVAKKADYFTSCLPAPQKGSPVMLPVGDKAPLVGSDFVKTDTGEYISKNFVPVRYRRADGSVFNPGQYTFGTTVVGAATPSSPLTAYNGTIDGTVGTVYPSNLVVNFGGGYADLTQAQGISVNDFRLLVQTQKMLEKDARGGSRFNEFALMHFGVTLNDSRIQFPEYLGGGRIPINIQQVAQTSAGTEASPLAELGAFSHSVGSSRFVKSFVEPGYLITVGCIRQIHSYSQGVRRFWSRSKREDFYDPLYNNIGEQPVYRSEIYAEHSYSDGMWFNIFGYQEAWADYRHAPNMTTGGMRPGSYAGLGEWTFADYYKSVPTLSDGFVQETSEFVDRTLSAPSTSIPNFIADFWFDLSAVRVMGVRSTPGLVDHH